MNEMRIQVQSAVYVVHLSGEDTDYSEFEERLFVLMGEFNATLDPHETYKVVNGHVA